MNATKTQRYNKLDNIRNRYHSLAWANVELRLFYEAQIRHIDEMCYRVLYGTIEAEKVTE